MKKIICLLISFVIVISLVMSGTVNTMAAGSSTMSFSSKQVKVGDSVSVTVKINTTEKMYAQGFVLKYEPSDVLEFVGGDGSGGAGVLRVEGNADETTSASFTFNFKAKKAGSCYISTADMTYVTGELEEIAITNQGANLTVTDASLSANANLKSLSLSDGKISPAFSASTTSYSATVDKGVTSCKIYATAADAGAKVAVAGGSNLKVGKNYCSVTVTAPNGTQKVYKITITRSEVSSEDETSSDEASAEKGKNPNIEVKETLGTQIDGNDYYVAKTLEGVTLPGGFSQSTVQYNGEDVTVAVDEGQNFSLYYLGTKDSETIEPYTYDMDANVFTKLSYLKQGEYFYIFAPIPDGFTVPEDYYTTNTEISGFNVACYSSSEQELASFYYVYCFNGKEYGFYRYDSTEKVLQRYPEMKMEKIDVLVEENDGEDFMSRFNSLTSNGKVIVIGIGVAIIGILALIVLIIIKLLHRQNDAEVFSNLNYTEKFDNIESGSVFSLEKDNGFITGVEDDYEEPVALDEEHSEDEIESDYVTTENDEQ